MNKMQHLNFLQFKQRTQNLKNHHSLQDNPYLPQNHNLKNQQVKTKMIHFKHNQLLQLKKQFIKSKTTKVQYKLHVKIHKENNQHPNQIMHLIRRKAEIVNNQIHFSTK